MRHHHGPFGVESTAASTAATWSSSVADADPSPCPGRVSGTGRWPSASSAGTTSAQADPSSHRPAMSTMSMIGPLSSSAVGSRSASSRCPRSRHARPYSGRSTSGSSGDRLICSGADPISAPPHAHCAPSRSSRPAPAPQPTNSPRDWVSRIGPRGGTSGSSARQASRSSRPGARTAGTGSGAGRGCLRSSSPRPRHSAWSWQYWTASRRPPMATTSWGLPSARSSGPCPRASAGRRRRCGSTRRPRPGRNSARPDPATTSELVAAVAARRRVLVTYRSETGNQWEAEVDPWAVVVRYGRWYLLCHSPSRGCDPHLPDRPRPCGPADCAQVRASRRSRPGGSAWRKTWRRVGSSLPASCSTLRGQGGAVDPARHGTPRTIGRRLRARRQHEQSGDVRTGVVGDRCRSPSASTAAQELRAAVATVAARFAAALPD